MFIMEEIESILKKLHFPQSNYLETDIVNIVGNWLLHIKLYILFW